MITLLMGVMLFVVILVPVFVIVSPEVGAVFQWVIEVENVPHHEMLKDILTVQSKSLCCT